MFYHYGAGVTGLIERRGDRPAATATGKGTGYWLGRPPTLTPSTRAQTKGEPMGISALDLFAGAGGWSVAAERIGIDETGVEIMPEAVATRAAAGFKTHEVGDVWQFDFVAARGLYDGLIASPPCQTFSTAGKGAGRKALDDVIGLIHSGAFKSIDALRAGGLGDERTALVLTPLHAAWEMRPEWIAWEQVPTVLPVWEACAEELRSWGYSVWTGNLQAEQYGVPQTRKRAFLLAHREREVAPPVPTHSRYYSRTPEKLDEGVQKWVSMAEALGWGDRSLRSNYGTGGDPQNRGAEGSVRVTVQEAGILQSFPPDFPWQGSKTKQYLQCGNACPPLLAEAVLRQVVEA